MNYIYSRQSSQKEDKSISCEEQVSNCKKYAEENNLPVKDVFTDIDVSGRLFPKQFAQLAEIDLVYKQFLKETKKEGQTRVGLGQLFDKLKDGDTIIVDDLSRFYRPLTNSYLESALTQFLIEKKIRLLTVKNGEVNLNNFNDNLINALQNRINDNQLSIQRKKSKASLSRLYNSGEYHASVGMMIGYKSTGKKKEVEIDETKAPIVKYVFKAYIEGKSLLQIVRDLNSKFGMKSCVKCVKNILNRPLYCGYQYDKQGQLVKSKQVEGKELIDFNTWTTAKKILDSRKTNNIRIKIYPLHWTGLCYCGKCGAKMSVCINQKGKYFSFRCMSHTIRDKENCKVSITSNTLYSKGLSMDDAIEPILILGLLKKLSEQKKAVEIKDQLEAKTIELNNLTSKEKQLSSMFLEGLMSEDALKMALIANKAKKDVLQQEIIALEQNLTEDDVEKTRLLVNKIVGRGLSFEEYQELIALTIKQIEVQEHEIKVKTFNNDIIIPRKKISGQLRLPNYIWKNDGQNFRIYYYFNSPNIYAKRRLLFDKNNLKIYFIEE